MEKLCDCLLLDRQQLIWECEEALKVPTEHNKVTLNFVPGPPGHGGFKENKTAHGPSCEDLQRTN